MHLILFHRNYLLTIKFIWLEVVTDNGLIDQWCIHGHIVHCLCLVLYSIQLAHLFIDVFMGQNDLTIAFTSKDLRRFHRNVFQHVLFLKIHDILKDFFHIFSYFFIGILKSYLDNLPLKVIQGLFSPIIVGSRDEYKVETNLFSHIKILRV